MIKLYHNPISPNSRRVWITLLEKGLEFELVEVKLDGEQFKPDFLAISLSTTFQPWLMMALTW